MATLDDIPILPPTTPTTDDLIAVIDGGDRRSPKQVSLAQLGGLLGGGAAESLTPSQVSTIGLDATISTRLTVRESEDVGILTLPAASGALRELYIINRLQGPAFLNVTTGLIVSGSNAIQANSVAHLMSDGVEWYRVG